MDCVVDANILFASLIKEGKTLEILLGDTFRFFSPEFLLEEFSKYKDYILQKTKRTEKELIETFDLLLGVITIVPKQEYSGFLGKAGKICPDEDDIFYFSLALKLNCGLWSNEIKLKEQDIVHVYSTKDLIELFFV